MRAESTTENKGSMLVEALIAIAVLTLGISASVMLAFANQTLRIDSRTNSEALSMAASMLEGARANSALDFALVNPVPASTIDIYIASVDVNPIDFWIKEVTSIVKWTSEGGRLLSVKLSTLVTDPKGPGGGNTCNSVLSGDWTNPQKTEYELGADILSDMSSGFPITGMRSFDKKLYVSVHNDNGNNDETFIILDITDPTVEPTVIDKIDNNPARSDGLNDVKVDGVRYAYVASAYSANFGTCVNPNGANLDCGQLQVIDLSTSPSSVVYTYKAQGVTGNSGAGIGKKVFYKDGIVYVGLAKTTGPEFHLVDVGGGGTPGASPTSPKHLDSVEIDNGVNAIYVSDTYAYVASPNDEELKIFDVSDPTDVPAAVGRFDAPGGGGNNGNGKSLYLVGNNLYFGRTLLNGDEFYVLDTIDPETDLPALGQVNVQNASNNNTSVNGVVIRDYLAFLITNEELQIWRIDNPGSITQHDPDPFLTLPPGAGGGQEGTAVDCEGNYLYIGSMSSNDKGYISIITAN